jgi:soluble lytic murein transglycosylase-like protein
MKLGPITLIGCLVLPLHSLAHCFQEAASRYRVPTALLIAVARHESSGQPSAVHLNPNGSRDIGLMQINSNWLPFLARHGVQEKDLFDPCVNVLVGAWIMSQNFQRHGYNTQGLGAYNAVTPWKRERYARQILQSFEY